MLTQDLLALELMPRLSSNLTGCVRWRWTDLQEMLERQLELIDTGAADGATDRGETIAQ